MADKAYLIDRFVKNVIAFAAAIAVVIVESAHMIEVSVTGDMTVNLDAASLPNPGDRITFKIISDGSIRTITWGTNITGADLVTVASKTHTQQFEYDGAAFIAVGPNVQID